ncbi:MAG: SDR family NAD(P)-dependent oxidoreductase, partial [Lachnospiraceae bacterium]|nr:SDR family NAD(P)-dependent oxidoreductase [Lachnospiraceae bacterium]
MSDTVMVTGTGRSYALGYNIALRYLEAGDTVIATIRKPSPDIDALKEKYGDRLMVVTMDLTDTASVNAAAAEVSGKVDHIDILINNAVGVA